MSKLPVSEQFFSLQGEGPYTGTPSVFLRLAGCNLQCGHSGDIQDFEPGDEPSKEGAEWICDSIATWREPEDSYDGKELFEEWEARGWIESLSDEGAHIVLTGGEPMLPAHQDRFSTFYYQQLYRHVDPFVEVETNGTQPVTDAVGCVDHFNVSLKLSNSGHSEEERLNRDAINQFAQMGSPFSDAPAPTAMFKFVVAKHDDVDEIQNIISRFNISDEMVSLMPAGANQEELAETYPLVAEICKREGYRFSPRLHVDIWNMATSV